MCRLLLGGSASFFSRRLRVHRPELPGAKRLRSPRAAQRWCVGARHACYTVEYPHLDAADGVVEMFEGVPIPNFSTMNVREVSVWLDDDKVAYDGALQFRRELLNMYRRHGAIASLPDLMEDAEAQRVEANALQHARNCVSSAAVPPAVVAPRRLPQRRLTPEQWAQALSARLFRLAHATQ